MGLSFNELYGTTIKTFLKATTMRSLLNGYRFV